MFIKSIELITIWLLINIINLEIWVPWSNLYDRMSCVMLSTSHDLCSTCLHDMRANSSVPGKFEWRFRYLMFQIISVINGWDISCELPLKWMSIDLTGDKSTLVPIMAWCRQAPSHYLSQYWLRSLSSYVVTRPQWVKAGRCVIVFHIQFGFN